MKCTDNRKRRRRRLTKRERRKRALIRLMRRILFLLCICLAAIVGIRTFDKKPKAAEFEKDKYDTAYHKEELYASDLCVVSPENSIGLSNVSDLKAYGLFDVNEKNPSYAYQTHNKIYPASTTKILTALVALENADLSDSVTISKNACSSGFAWDEQTCGIKEGDIFTLEDLLYGLLLYSGNDTAVAVAEHVGGSVEAFANMMNAKAKELMATNSHFVNPSGLYDDNHYTTAYDLYLIFNACIKNPDFVKIISADSYTAEVKRADSTAKSTLKWEPTNYYALGKAKSPAHVTVIGGKTGTLKAAGSCLILMAEDTSNNPYISVVMGADTKDLLYQDMTTLLGEIPQNTSDGNNE